jgi:hypothetical protein
MKTSINKYLYIGFVIFGLYQLLLKHSASEAVTQLGIALIFDPFDTEQPWKERPIWQKGVLILHLAVVFSLIGYEIGSSGGDLIKGIQDGWNGK